MAYHCEQTTITDVIAYYTADAAQKLIDEHARKESRRPSSFLTSLVSIGAYIALEVVKSSINEKLCTPLKPLASTKFPNYSYSTNDSVEIKS
jgi:hypothetical protein